MWWVRKQSRVSQAGDGIVYSRTGDGTYYSMWATGDGQISRAEYSRTGDVQSSVIRWASTWPQPRPQTTTLKTNHCSSSTWENLETTWRQPCGRPRTTIPTTNHCSSSTWDNLEIDLRQLGNKFETTWIQLEDNFETTPSDHHPHLLSICHYVPTIFDFTLIFSKCNYPSFFIS